MVGFLTAGHNVLVCLYPRAIEVLVSGSVDDRWMLWLYYIMMLLWQC